MATAPSSAPPISSSSSPSSPPSSSSSAAAVCVPTSTPSARVSLLAPASSLAALARATSLTNESTLSLSPLRSRNTSPRPTDSRDLASIAVARGGPRPRREVPASTRAASARRLAATPWSSSPRLSLTPGSFCCCLVDDSPAFALALPTCFLPRSVMTHGSRPKASSLDSSMVRVSGPSFRPARPEARPLLSKKAREKVMRVFPPPDMAIAATPVVITHPHPTRPSSSQTTLRLGGWTQPSPSQGLDLWRTPPPVHFNACGRGPRAGSRSPQCLAFSRLSLAPDRQHAPAPYDPALALALGKEVLMLIRDLSLSRARGGTRGQNWREWRGSPVGVRRGVWTGDRHEGSRWRGPL